MCNIGAIAAFIASASIALIGAAVAFAIAAVNAGTFWGAFGNAVPMGIAGVFVGLALGAVSAAAALVSPCRVGPCKVAADNLFTALLALDTALTILLAAGIAGVIPGSIPYVGVAVAIALAAGAVACSITLGIISTQLDALDRCRRAPAAPETPAVTVAKVAVAVASIVSLVFGLGTGAVGVPECVNSRCE
jgi:hypothetical protein